MNLLNFLQRVGFPMDVNVLDNMQKAYQLFNGLGALAGDLSIIKGCELTGNTVSNGVVYINGEVLEFRSGLVSENVIIVEEKETAEFENTEIHEIHYVRYATFGVATTSYPWASFKRAFPTRDIATALAEKVNSSAMPAILERITTLEKKNAVFQEGGGMVLWNKPASKIPAGWAEVVNWRGRIPAGWNPNDSDFDTVGETGGQKTKQLSTPEIPAHSHKLFSPAATAVGIQVTANTHPIVSSDGTGWGNDSYRIRASNAQPSLGHSGPEGSGNEFSIMNPYRVVLFIEYVG
jgi:hypothetical protein